MKVLPFGDAALLVEVDGLPEVLALAAAVRKSGCTTCNAHGPPPRVTHDYSAPHSV